MMARVGWDGIKGGVGVGVEEKKDEGRGLSVWGEGGSRNG